MIRRAAALSLLALAPPSPASAGVGATTFTMRATVQPGAKVQATAQAPKGQTVDLEVNIGGEFMTFERVTPGVAYVYDSGVVAQLSTCSRRWTPAVSSQGRRARTVTVKAVIEHPLGAAAPTKASA